MCYIEPLNVKNKIDKNAPFYQHILTRVIQYYLKNLNNFEMGNPSFSLISNIVWKYFFLTRAFIQSYNIIELSECKELENENLLIYSPCREDNNIDLLIIYVPNIPLLGSSPYFYAEYLITLQSLLLLQGFNNPNINIMKFPEECKTSTIEYVLNKFIENYINIVRDNTKSKIILMGDSIGATIILNFLMIKNKLFFNEELNNDLLTEEIEDPFSVILISPIVDLNYNNIENTTTTTNNNPCFDYLKQENINDLSILFCNNKKFKNFNPILWDKIEIWDKIIPKGGMIISFGKEELQSCKIEIISKIAFKSNRVKILKTENKGHCWQFISFLTEETQDEKEDSCFLFAGLISRMVLFQTDTYRDPDLATEPMNMLSIDDDHL